MAKPVTEVYPKAGDDALADAAEGIADIITQEFGASCLRPDEGNKVLVLDPEVSLCYVMEFRAPTDEEIAQMQVYYDSLEGS